MNKLTKRFTALAPINNKRWYRIENAAKDEAKIYIYDVISWYGVSADEFVKDLNAVTAKTINLHINSPGGDVFDGMAIHSALKSHPAKIITKIDGLAASIASVIALAGDEIHIAKGGFFMIHNAFSGIIGDANDMRKMADVLDKITGSIAGFYADKIGKSEEYVLDKMNDETWYTAAEALDEGFVDVVIDGETAKAKFDLSVYNNAPDSLNVEVEERSIETIRDFENFLRDAGFSRNAAKAIAANGFRSDEDSRDETPSDVSKETINALREAFTMARLTYAFSKN